MAKNKCTGPSDYTCNLTLCKIRYKYNEKQRPPSHYLGPKVYFRMAENDVVHNIKRLIESLVTERNKNQLYGCCINKATMIMH